MTATAHALIGASIAANFSNPFIGIPLAIVSHYIADYIPHWDAGTNHRKKTKKRLRIEAAIDVLIGFALSYIIFRNLVSTNYLFVMIIAAQLPDWLDIPSWSYGVKKAPFCWINYLSHKIQNRMQLPWGLVTQVAVVAALILITISLTQTNASFLTLGR